jgi:DNA-binding NtrC family response regulator
MKKHILLVDNDEIEVEQFTRALSKLSLSTNCICVKSTEHALDVLNNYSPDFIFIDYDVSKERALRCLQQIKKLRHVKDVPVILYSNQMDEENNLRAISMGAFACMKKPSMTGTLARKLKEIMVRKLDGYRMYELDALKK